MTVVGEPASPGVADISADSCNYTVVVPDAATDYIQGRLVQTATPYEHEMLRDMASRLSPGDVVLDVGANIGNHTLYLAVVAAATVVAYEPNERLTEPLQQSIVRNGLVDRVRVRPVAVGDRAGRGSFLEEMPANLGAQSVETDDGGPLEVVRLDDEELPARAAMIKIDVEGMELSVLRGAERLIAAHRPTIYVECRSRDDFVQVDRWASSHGYVLCDEFNATPTFRLEPSERLSEADRLDRAIARALRERFELSERLGETRARLDEANLKYRTLSGAHQTVLAELDDARARLEAAAEAERRAAAAPDVVQQLREQVSRLETEHAATARRLQDEVAQHRRALLSAREDRDGLVTRATRSAVEAQAQKRVAESRLVQQVRSAAERERHLSRERDDARAAQVLAEAERAQLREQLSRRDSERAAGRRTLEEAELSQKLLRDERDRLTASLADARAEVAAQRQAVRDLRESLTFRTGKEVRRASSSVGAALRLPISLARLARQQRNGRPGRVVEIEARPAAPLRVEAPSIVAAIDVHRVAPTAEPVPGSRRTRGQRLRVAAIMDEFTRLSFAPEWDLMDLTPGGWEQELSACDPDLLFVESAWRGRDGSWHNMVDRAGDELRGIVDWCRAHSVPTVFWNKEDPVHYATFLNAARLFDHVFTTDIDRIEHYKAALGHDRVWLLPFAAQPASYHPIAHDARQDAFMFAGAYYRRYPERTRDLESFMEHLPQLRSVQIYDRNFGGADEAYRFPEAYQESIVGTLAPEDVAAAYRSYRFAINLNSVKQSQTMLARRIFELLASGTLAVSNFSRAARVYFGDTVVTTDSGAEAVRRLVEIADTGTEDEIRLAGLRAVMAEHTYDDRARYIWAKVAGETWEPWSESVDVVAVATNESELEAVVSSLLRQEHASWNASVLVTPDVRSPAPDDDRIALVPVDAAPTSIGQLGAGGRFLAAMWHGDYYGPHYLLDLALGTRYAAADVLGKSRHFRRSGEQTVLVDGVEHRESSRIGVRRSIARRASVSDMATEDVLDLLRHDGAWGLEQQVALDRFGYCAETRTAPEVDDRGPVGGTSLRELVSAAEAIQPSSGDDARGETLGAAALAALFDGSTRVGLAIGPSERGLRVSSALATDTHDYIYARHSTPVTAGWVESGELYVDTEPGLDLQVALVFQDADGNRLGSTVVRSNTNSIVAVPGSTVRVKLGIRVRGRGEGVLRGVSWGHRVTEPAEILPRAQSLVLTNIYPSYEDLYRNGFVHSRVRAYRAVGHGSEVFCLAEGSTLSYREFEGVDVTTGGSRALRAVLRDHAYRSVLVHFLDPLMWESLKHRRSDVRVVIWVHGSEVQPWWRRAYNIVDDRQLEAEKERSARRLAFWRDVFTSAGDDVHFVFVSRYFADEVMEDVGVRLTPGQYSIVHNPVDVELFHYVPKPAEQRLNILSIRPFASRKYANDLSVAAVQLLCDEPEFDSMRFRFVGDGALFDETLAPIRHLENVEIERRFLSQREIAAMHREHGVFLVPTRMDAQGVSRDEAMASGLVPVTNGVAAVPEFVDDASGVVVPGDDPEALAAGLLELVRDPERFERLSRAAAERVRAQSASDLVIDAEIALITGRGQSDLRGAG